MTELQEEITTRLDKILNEIEQLKIEELYPFFKVKKHINKLKTKNVTIDDIIALLISSREIYSNVNNMKVAKFYLELYVELSNMYQISLPDE